MMSVAIVVYNIIAQGISLLSFSWLSYTNVDEMKDLYMVL